jgi:hypothetical protein
MESDETDDEVKADGGSAGAVPGPTYAPPALAMGIMLFFWGSLTHWFASLAGLGLMIFALGKWVNEIRANWKEES